MTHAAVVLVDARNVLRSRWPNIPEEELVELCCDWAGRNGVRAVIVFDGGAPHGPESGDCTVVGTAGESADEWLMRRAVKLRAEGTRFWLVTSDRALREAAGEGAERTIGGGRFAAELTGSSAPARHSRRPDRTKPAAPDGGTASGTS